MLGVTSVNITAGIIISRSSILAGLKTAKGQSQCNNPSFIALPRVVLLAAFASSDTKADGVASRRFEKRCTDYHAIDRDKVGPRLAAVVGRKAGAVCAFPYSDAVTS
jgi:cytochrome c2